MPQGVFVYIVGIMKYGEATIHAARAKLAARESTISTMGSTMLVPPLALSAFIYSPSFIMPSLSVRRLFMFFTEETTF